MTDRQNCENYTGICFLNSEHINNHHSAISTLSECRLNEAQTGLEKGDHVKQITSTLLTLRRLMSYIYGAPILDVSRSHTTTQHSR